MYEKNGFTIIEVLAVIVVLAIIILIATPIILDVINNVKIEAHIDNEKMLTRAAEIYLTKNTEYLPDKVGDTSEITLEELRSKKLINEIKSPGDGNNSCSGYILVTKLGANNYDFTPYLNCSELINNSSEDGLLAHYKFDDFQEPTKNLLINPTFDTTSNWYLSTIGEGDFTTNNNWGKINIPELESGNYYFLYQNIDRITEANTDITFSVDFKNDIVGTFALRLVMFKDGPAVRQPLTKVTLDGTGGTRRFHVTTSYTDVTDKLRADILAGSWYGSYGGLSDVSVEFSNVQLEEKSYPTPFISDLRDGIIKDYSINNNHILMDLNTSPKWVKTSQIGAGAYEFSGRNVVTINNSETLSQANGIDKPFSISMWVKANQRIGTDDGFINLLGQSGSYDGLAVSFANSDTKLRLRYWQDGGTNLDWEVQNFINSWNQIVITAGNNRINTYQNGELIRSDIFTNPFSLNGKVILGQYLLNDNYYDGFIDEVKLYSRVLNENEIKLNYEINK